MQINDDNAADWAVRKIAEHEAERDRLLAIADAQIKEIEAKIKNIKSRCDAEKRVLTAALANYFETVPQRETKTTKVYTLLSGKLKFKKPAAKMVPDDAALLAWLKENGAREYVKVKEEPAWGEIKKQLQVVNNKVIIAATGEVVQGVAVEKTAGEFVVEVNTDGNNQCE